VRPLPVNPPVPDAVRGEKLEDLLPADTFEAVVEASHHTQMNPFMTTLDKSVALKVGNSILNEISGRFSDGFWLQAAGKKCDTTWFRFGLTFEWIPVQFQDSVFSKLRVMVASDDVLEQVAHMDESGECPAYEVETHSARWTCLRTMARLAKQGKSFVDESHLGRIALVLPA